MYKVSVNKFLRFIMWVYAATPFVAVIVFSVYAYFVKSELGRWPVVYEDTLPESLKLLDQFTSIFVYGFLLSFTSVFFTLPILLFKSLRNTYWKCFLVYLVGVLLVIALSGLTPLGSVVEWYLD